MRRCPPLVLASCALVLVLYALAGCGDGRASKRSATGSSPDTSTTPDADARERADEAPAEPVLNRHDAPPKGVARQIQYFGVGDSFCPNMTGPVVAADRRPFYQFGGPRNAVDPEIGEQLTLCAVGFQADLSIDETLELPDGRVLRHVDPAGSATPTRTWHLYLDEHWPHGPHVFMARQNGVVRRLEFAVALPRHRGVRVDEGAISAGDSVHLMVVGQRPHATVPVDVYRSRVGVAGEPRYATTLRMSTDRRGIGALVVTTSPRDAGSYVLRPRTALRRDGQDAFGTLFVGEPLPPMRLPSRPAASPAPTVFQATEQAPPGATERVAYTDSDGIPPGCVLSEEAGPHITWDREEPRADFTLDAVDQAPELGDRLTLCADDFPAAVRLRLDVVAPDGTRQTVRMPPPENDVNLTRSTYTQVLMPDAPLGEYRVVVSGGGARAQSSFWLSQPRTPGYRLLIRGRRLSLLGVGLPPGQDAALLVYRGPRLPEGAMGSAEASYAGALPVHANADGVVQLVLPPLRSDDPAACYPMRLAYGARVVPPAYDGTTVCLPLGDRLAH